MPCAVASTQRPDDERAEGEENYRAEPVARDGQELADRAQRRQDDADDLRPEHPEQHADVGQEDQAAELSPRSSPSPRSPAVVMR